MPCIVSVEADQSLDVLASVGEEEFKNQKINCLKLWFSLCVFFCFCSCFCFFELREREHWEEGVVRWYKEKLFQNGSTTKGI